MLREGQGDALPLNSCSQAATLRLGVGMEISVLALGNVVLQMKFAFGNVVLQVFG